MAPFKRKVLHLGGFDPRGARFYHQLLGEQVDRANAIAAADGDPLRLDLSTRRRIGRDAIRGTLDGHIVLDRAIADAARYPAINVLGSISRLAQHVWTPDQRQLVGRLRAMISRFEDTRDLRLMGGLQTGMDADLDQAVMLTPIIYDALTQAPDSPPSTDAFRELAEALSRTR